MPNDDKLAELYKLIVAIGHKYNVHVHGFRERLTVFMVAHLKGISGIYIFIEDKCDLTDHGILVLLASNITSLH